MINKLHLYFLFFAAIVIWILCVLVGKILGQNIGFLEYSRYVLPILGVLTWLFDSFVWKWKILYPWFTDKPDISGTWKVILESSYVSPDTGKGVGPIEAYMSIKQSFSKLNVRLMTMKSLSDSVTGSFSRHDNGLPELAMVYLNKPRYDSRANEAAQIHYGAALIDISVQKPNCMTGHYWTDRKTAGTMSLIQRVAGEKPSYDEAKKAFESC